MELTQDQITCLTRMLFNYQAFFQHTIAQRPRFQYIDRSIEHTVDRSKEAMEALQAHYNGERKGISNVEVPEGYSQLSAAHAFLVGTFLSGSPIFGCVATKSELQDEALALQALCTRDQRKWAWIAELTQAMQDGLAYNQMALECSWAAKRSRKVTSAKAGVALVEEEYSGNQFKRIDPYNFVYDPTVPLHDLAKRGAFAGYVERYSYINSKEMLAGMSKDFGVFKNHSTALSSGPTIAWYYVPDVAIGFGTQYNANDWRAYFGSYAINANSSENVTGIYEWITLYTRIVPQEYGFTRVAKAGTPAIYKVQFVNGILVYCEPLANAHGLLPITACTVLMPKLRHQAKSFAERVLAYQEVSTALLNGTLASLRRAVGDRALYDPTRIRAEDLKGSSPVAKIPVRTNQFNKSLSDAYHQIPFEDGASQYFNANMQVIQSLAQRASGINQAAQGSFVRGNRTMEEFTTVMSNADSRQQTMALHIDSTFMEDLRTMVLNNYLQYAVSESIPNVDGTAGVNVDPQKLREAALQFTVTDGVNPNSKVANHAALTAAINLFAQNPLITAQYDVGKIMATLLKTSGLNLMEYERTPEEQQRYLGALTNGAPANSNVANAASAASNSRQG